MENIDNLLQIYEQLRICTNPDEVETLKNSLNRCKIQSKVVEKDSDRDPCKNDGSNELGNRNAGPSRMLLVAEKSRDVDNLIKEVKKLAKIEKLGDDLTIEVHEEIQVQFLTSELVGDEFASNKHKISNLLIKNKASTIGVWGMGGVGKTTLISHLHNMMLAYPDSYGNVYWITVSKDCSIQKLQTDIAKRIGVYISDKLDELERPGILAKALRRKKKFVLILDDMWSDLDLNKVGLGFPKEIGYQLIITSRSKDVCLKMYCDHIIKVNPLSPKDAWTLFVRSIGGEIPYHLTDISTNVLKECAGLPLGIITLAKSMIGCNDICEWRHVLNELQNSSGKVDDMEEKIFNELRLSYERLKGHDLKECLLYCATYPEDFRIPIDELIWLFIDSGLLGENVGMAGMFDKGFAILKKLERAALLSIERFFYFDDEVVLLHDLIRDMTLQIASSRFMIKDEKGLKGISDGKNWTDQLEVVSLMEINVEVIFDFSPKCNQLSTVLLQRSYLPCLSDGFFKYSHQLKHLNLSFSHIITLPESVSLLKNLTALILRCCLILENVPSLAKLTSLERLDLYKTCVSQLPKGLKGLIKLRYLNLVKTKIEKISAGVISKLIALQYLGFDARIDDVKVLNSLNRLERLTVQIKDLLGLCTFIDQMTIKGGPKSYVLVFGGAASVPEVLNDNWNEKKISLRKTPTLGEKDMRSLVDVNKHNHLLKILFNNDWESFECWPFNLWRRTEIERRAKLFCENELQKVLQDINSLELWGTENLMSLEDFVFDTKGNRQRQLGIECGPKPFSNLKILRLYHCPNLKRLFPLELLSNLQNIEEISVYFCEGMEELIAGVGHPKKLSIPKLRLIRLKDLPNLQSLCYNDKVISAPCLQWIEIKSCPKLKRMPFDVDSQHQPFPHLRYWEEEKDWVESLEWDPPESICKVYLEKNPYASSI